MTDKPILLRLKEGDTKAFEKVYWEYNPIIYHFVLSLLYDKSLAEDLTQSVFLKIWERREAINPELSFEAYLYTVARHLVYKETEKAVCETSLDWTEVADMHDGALLEKKLEAKSLKDYIEKLINQLPSARREIFYLSRREHLSQKEIAERLSVSEKTVETQLYRALRFLKEQLKSDLLIAWILIEMIK